ncbi:hypothetical protein A0O34_21975 (plasmid) [Chryseobacterium glaciei]|uniref:Type IX secretion system membrane protein PorP/SprF n=1 Tax=Chryseobacterium glaciei TaxID=1685010 RepID=A0A172Y2B4_9FLAO|nr:hypothetical protein A0O34_21975 [Chryseobacterium glaciei]
MAAVSYKFTNPNFTIEPKAVYRGVENYKDMVDIGGEFICFENKLMMSAMYHSTHSVTAGIGTFYQISFGYSVFTRQVPQTFENTAMANLKLRCSIN